MSTGFEVDGQRIARMQVEATNRLASAIEELTRAIRAEGVAVNGDNSG